MAGVPDIVACVNGLFVAFEIKSPKKKDAGVDGLQAYHKKKILESRGMCYSVNNYSDYLKIILHYRNSDVAFYV